MKLSSRLSVGLALSGGGARGLAHIGVLRVLEREGIPVDCLAGTSMGGVIAAGFAAGMSSIDLERETLAITQKRHFIRLADPGLPDGGLIHGNSILAYFRQEFGDKTFSELNLPVAVVAVDLNSHQEVVLREGSVALGLRATTSLPGLIKPLEMDGMRLVDGGVLNNLPVDVVSQMGAEVIIAVNTGLSLEDSTGKWLGSNRWIPEGIGNILETLDDTLYTMRIEAYRNRIDHFKPNVLISPELPANVNSLAGYGRVKELISAGERAAENHLAEIRAILQC
ncbi:MAG TPA: patatin-like phospholipase family protein [Anaerolineaceae bacterium]|nr:patatin-like phospholipase family protein [Anaerolineaceae bacterium]